MTALPQSILDGTERHLEIIVGGAALAPRQRLVSVPYALVAASVAGGKVAASSLEVGGTTVVDSSGQIDWTRLKGLPSGFADGIDDVGVTDVKVAAPLSGNGTAGSPVALAAASGSAAGHLTPADWTAFNDKLASVAIAAPLTGDGKAGSPVTLPAASASANGFLAATDWTAFNGKLASASAAAPLSGNGTPGAPLSLAPASAGADGFLAKADWAAFDGKVSSVKAGAGVAVTGTKDPTVEVKFGTAAGTAAAGDHTHAGLGNPGLNLLRNPSMQDRDADTVPDFATKDVDNTNYQYGVLTNAEVHAILGGTALNASVKMNAIIIRSTVSAASPTETMTFASSIVPDRSLDVPVTCSVYVRRPDTTGTNAKAKIRCFDKEATLSLPNTDQNWARMSVSTRVTTATAAINGLVVWGSGYKTGADMAYLQYALPKIEYGTSATDWNANDEMTVAGDWQVDGNLNVGGRVAAASSVRVGTDTATCAAGNSGAMRYSSSTGWMEVCNGTSWRSLGDRRVTYETSCVWRTTNSGSSAPPTNGSCAAPACGAGHTDLGTYTLEDVTFFNYDPWCCWFGTSMGRTVRNCLVPDSAVAAVYTVKCGWRWSTYDGTTQNFTSCTPAACGSGHTDLGTNNVIKNGYTYTQYPYSHDISAVTGHTERTCMIRF